jgi:hypothetical protein
MRLDLGTQDVVIAWFIASLGPWLMHSEFGGHREVFITRRSGLSWKHEKPIVLLSTQKTY